MYVYDHFIPYSSSVQQNTLSGDHEYGKIGMYMTVNKSKEEVLASVALLKIKYPVLINLNIEMREGRIKTHDN